MSEDKKNVHIDPDEFAAAEAEATESKPEYIHKFAKPFKYDGKEIISIAFDFDGLTGADSLAIESELARLGKNIVAPAFSIDYLIRMAARASSPVVGVDAFSLMPIRDFNKIRSAARGFLLISEL